MICEIYRRKWTFSWQKSSAKGRHCETTPETSRKHPEGNPRENMLNLQISGKRTVDFRTFRKITARTIPGGGEGKQTRERTTGGGCPESPRESAFRKYFRFPRNIPKHKDAIPENRDSGFNRSKPGRVPPKKGNPMGFCGNTTKRGGKFLRTEPLTNCDLRCYTAIGPKRSGFVEFRIPKGTSPCLLQNFALKQNDFWHPRNTVSVTA